MSVKTRELLLPISKRRKGNKLKQVNGVTIHNTGNNSKGANANANARYQKNSCNDAGTGWHWTVDETEAILSIPENEIAEHTGKRTGNDTTVGIEICDNIDGDALQATDNGAWLAAQVLKRQGFTEAVWKKNIFQHNDWSGKNCPEQIRKGKPYTWQKFVEKVNTFMKGQEIASKPVEQPTQSSVPTETPKPVQSVIELPDGLLYFRLVTTERVYRRTAPTVNSTIAETLNAGVKLRYRGEEGNYYYVSVDGTGVKGYVAKSLVKADYLSKSDGVKALQKKLGVTADGLYGKDTAKAVGAAQRAANLTVDYIYGPNTKRALEAK